MNCLMKCISFVNITRNGMMKPSCSKWIQKIAKQMVALLHTWDWHMSYCGFSSNHSMWKVGIGNIWSWRVMAKSVVRVVRPWKRVRVVIGECGGGTSIRCIVHWIIQRVPSWGRRGPPKGLVEFHIYHVEEESGPNVCSTLLVEWEWSPWL